MREYYHQNYSISFSRSPESIGRWLQPAVYCRRKFTSIFNETATGFPFFSPGLNFHCLSASTAFSVSPWSSSRRTFSTFKVPSTPIVALTTTVPSYFAAEIPSMPRVYWEGLFPRPWWGDLARDASENGLDPYLVAALINLANVHYSRDEVVEAQALYERAIGLEPDFFEAHFNLGNIYHDLARFAEAQSCYCEALRLNPSYADAHFYLAVTFEKMGQSHDARPHWKAYRELAPHGEWVELAKEFSE